MGFFAMVIRVLLFAVMTWQPSPQTGGGADGDFRAFLTSFEAGLDRFVNGDPTLWKQNLSHRDGTSIMGGWCGYEIGGQVGAINLLSSDRRSENVVDAS